ncbi:MAG TPA: hypothetical protein VFR19_21415 [Hyphomicrobiaceae bacterium]|nr:hypothetical protein [Hyphomicrobiaceae bacterium]
MPKFARVAVVRVGAAPKLSSWNFAPLDRELPRLCALATAWIVRMSGRGTLAYYRARHRPLAGPAPGARLPR